MATKSLSNPYDGDTSLKHGSRCDCESCAPQNSFGPDGKPLTDYQLQENFEAQAARMESHPTEMDSVLGDSFDSSDDMMDRVIESAIVRGVFGHSDPSRRDFIKLVGGGT
jgi:nitrate/nitrite transport system substrate-binding protein